jgi:hypothetical protein
MQGRAEFRVRAEMDFRFIVIEVDGFDPFVFWQANSKFVSLSSWMNLAYWAILKPPLSLSPM